MSPSREHDAPQDSRKGEIGKQRKNLSLTGLAAVAGDHVARDTCAFAQSVDVVGIGLVHGDDRVDPR